MSGGGKPAHSPAVCLTAYADGGRGTQRQGALQLVLTFSRGYHKGDTVVWTFCRKNG